MPKERDVEHPHRHPMSPIARWWASEVRQLDAPYPLQDLIKIEQRTVGDRLEVRAEIPGVDPHEDVKVSLGAGFLRIDAHRHKETDVESWTHVQSEFQYGSTYRIVALPHGVTADDVSARYRNGVLRVEVKLPTELGDGDTQAIPVIVD
jgi:HSP20 family protein